MFKIKAPELFTIIGICLFLYSQFGTFQKPQVRDDFSQNKNLGLPDAYNAHVLVEGNVEDSKKRNTFKYLGLGCIILGGLTQLIYTKRKKAKDLANKNNNQT